MKKLLKSRVLWASVCIILALGLFFILMASFKSQYKTVSVIKVVQEIKKGDVITDDMIAKTSIINLDVNPQMVQDEKEIVGRYATTDFSPDDFVLRSKLADSLPTAELKLEELDGTRLAISILIKSYSSGMSDKLAPGDIVSCIVTTKDGTSIPSALTYVEVLTVTTASGTDKQQAGEQLAEGLETVTVLATPAQATLLGGYDKTANIHFALVYRGDEAKAQEFIAKQDEVLKAEAEKIEKEANEIAGGNNGEESEGGENVEDNNNNG